MSEQEHREKAVDISVNLTSQLIAAAVAVLAILAAYVTFVVDNRQAAVLFYVLAAAAAFSIFSSAFCGAWGMDQLEANIRGGNWEGRKPLAWFRAQTILLGLGILCLLLSLFFLGTSKPEADVERLEKEILRLNKEVAELREGNRTAD